MIKFPITQKGFDNLEKELKNLKHIERPKTIEAIATAREFGDLSENAEYHAARDTQSFIEGRILDLEDKASRADIIDIRKLSGKQVKFGATVNLVDEETEEEVSYQIVGEYEANLTQKKISVVSPIAKALIGKSSGDIVEVSTPKGVKFYEILSVEFKESL